MKRALTGALAALCLAGCNSSSTSTLIAFETTVQNLALGACHAIPTIDSINNIIKASASRVRTAAEIAQLVCPATPAATVQGLMANTRVPDPVTITVGGKQVRVEFTNQVGK